MTAIRILPGATAGPVLTLSEGLSFWGGVNPKDARIIDTHHPAYGKELTGRVVLMPTSRGSCSGSGVLLDLCLSGRAPAALIFSNTENILTLGSLIAAEIFNCGFPILRVDDINWARLSAQTHLQITDNEIIGENLCLPLADHSDTPLQLNDEDKAILNGRDGPAAALAMRIICVMARQQGAEQLLSITRGHIDGCILAHHANLLFAEKMQSLGAQVRVPTTINAISVDRQNWQNQGVPPDFGNQAARLADAYVSMGCQPSFTCAPYLLDNPPDQNEDIAWAESNAVVFANSVLGARTPKHPDYLDLYIAMTGRAPLSGVYLKDQRRPQQILDIDVPKGADDAIWPLIGYLAGLRAADRIPLLRGLANEKPGKDGLKSLCAAFGTTSAAPMLHIEGITPESRLNPHSNADQGFITRTDLAQVWVDLNQGPTEIDLIAIGSPHASVTECQKFAHLLNFRPIVIRTIITAGRNVIARLKADGTLQMLQASGVDVIADLCWCSITEPVFPSSARTIMTNSGKYAHYGPGLSERALRFGSLNDCAKAALSGHAPADLPHWLSQESSFIQM